MWYINTDVKYISCFKMNSCKTMNLYCKSTLVIILVVLTNYTDQKQLPSFIKRCPYSLDSQVLGECVKNAFNENKERFVGGVPEMHIPLLDPFVVDEITLSNGDGSAVSLAAVFNNVKIEGSRNTIINRIDADLVNCKATMETIVPDLRITSDYKLNGRIMILTIDGSGPCQGNFTDIHSTTTLEGRKVKRHNKDYLEWTDPKIVLSIGGASYHFDNLFKNNKELTENTNKIFNENSVEILKEFKPLVEQTISTITFSMMQRVFHTYSLDELFIDYHR